MAVAVLSSGGSSMTNQLLANEMLLHALKEKGTIAEFKPEKSYGTPVKADIPKTLLKHAGIYGMTNQLIKVDISKAGEMSLSMVQMPDIPAEKYIYTADGNTKVSFVTEENGRTYLWSRLYVSLPGLGQMALSHYSGERLAAHDISEETAAAWKERDGKGKTMQVKLPAKRLVCRIRRERHVCELHRDQRRS